MTDYGTHPPEPYRAPAQPLCAGCGRPMAPAERGARFTMCGFLMHPNPMCRQRGLATVAQAQNVARPVRG